MTITVTPASGYEVDDVTVTDRDGDDVRVTKQSDTRYTFTMPDSKVEVEVSFVKTGETVQEPDTMTFSDIKAGDWFYDAVLYTYENGLMSGTGAAAFSPNQTLTRAMVAQVLYSMEGAPAGGTSTFTDVAAGTWYASAVNWGRCQRCGQRLRRRDLWPQRQRYPGTSGDDPVQLCQVQGIRCVREGQPVFLCRHVQCQHLCTGGYELGCRRRIDLRHGQQHDVPQGSATRAQFAVMLMQFCEEIAK